VSRVEIDSWLTFRLIGSIRKKHFQGVHMSVNAARQGRAPQSEKRGGVIDIIGL
jgi:hypothetical protein